ncbi:hypothetical protein GGR51DRAFT_571606 [Nemania sp. FL0031]|nr:hypothetical protein GGR51DRAFT_571606 [Nemania sp. FL0031]
MYSKYRRWPMIIIGVGYRTSAPDSAYISLASKMRSVPQPTVLGFLFSMASNLERALTKITLLNSRQIKQEVHIMDLEAQKTRYETIERLLKGRSDLFPDARPAKKIPFSRNPGFVGRAGELTTIATTLEPSDSMATNPTRAQRGLVLHGLGGMGKTEIALEYVYRAFEKFDSVLWIAAETEQKVANSFVEAASSLGIPIDKDDRPHDPVLKWLNSTHTSWLIVFDNAPDDDASFLRDFLPAGKGSVLVTTRNACFPREFSIAGDIALGPIDEDAAISILTSGLLDDPTEHFRAKASEICYQLGYLPLALSQTAGYLAESGSKLDDFLETYKDFENIAVLHATSRPSSTTGYQHNLSTVWAITISLLEEKSSTALKTLSLLAFLDPDGFPRSILERVGLSLNLTGDFQYLTERFPLQLSIRQLDTHNLVTLDRSNSIIKIHRVLQDSVMARLTQDQKIDAFSITVKILHEAFPSPELAESEGFAKVCERGDQLYPHIIALLSKYDHVKAAANLGVQIYTLMQRFFWYLHHRALYRTALPYFDIAIRIYNRDRTKNLIYLAQLQGRAGTIYRNSDNALVSMQYFREEIELYQEAIKAQQIEEHSAGLAYAYEHIGLATQQLGRYAEALSWHGKNIFILENFHSDDKSGLLLALVNKSWAMWKSGLLDETAALLESVIKEAQEILDRNSEQYQARRVLTYGMRALGNVYIDQDRWDDAFNMHQRAFDFQVQTWAGRHFETGVSCYKMAVHYERKGDITGAIQRIDRPHTMFYITNDSHSVLYESALVIFTDNPVSLETHIIRTRYRLGHVLLSDGDRIRGVALIEEAQKARQNLKGIPPDVDDSMEFYDTLVPYWAW